MFRESFDSVEEIYNNDRIHTNWKDIDFDDISLKVRMKNNAEYNICGLLISGEPTGILNIGCFNSRKLSDEEKGDILFQEYNNIAGSMEHEISPEVLFNSVCVVRELDFSSKSLKIYTSLFVDSCIRYTDFGYMIYTTHGDDSTLEIPLLITLNDKNISSISMSNYSYKTIGSIDKKCKLKLLNENGEAIRYLFW